MVKKLYVGNLGFSVSDSDLQQLFSPHGSVQSAKVIMDRDTNQSKGFGFVEFASDDEAHAAIAALDGKDHGGRTLKVNEAKTKTRDVSLRAAPMAGGQPVAAAAIAAPINAPW